ncbi:MAG TPA: carboxypeptidase regulatory-like domain-containing protein [Candidatus Eremiobacteraceae bacterium]|nr:carboxypeptidase regulatory-like domain-containing protein [Candidatus Eremiobacteraceae bacterium]
MLVVLFQGTWALAGTTGGLTGYVVQPDGTALADAKVTAASPSESATATTDASGHFSFVSLTPDTYTVTASKDGYDPTSQPGVTVLADSTAVARITLHPTVKVLGHVTSTAQAALVKAGTTADVYSINSTTSAKSATLGGGGSLGQAYGAIASQPGVVVPPGQSGWFQTIHIRGGDFDQVGYEFDGVPVLRSYDNYPTTSASTLGQQELQIYTGGAPANSESQGLAGYINQVIKSGTYPGFANLNLGIGSPTMYNSMQFEAGGATPNRNFSYYVAFGNSSQNFRWFDNNNGAGIQQKFGAAFAQLPCPVLPGTPQSGGGNPNLANCYATGIGPGGYALGPPVDSFNVAQGWDHESIMNLHFGIPHHNDSGKDDIQLLYDNTYLHNTYYSSASDWTVPGNPLFTSLNGGGSFGYLSGPGIGWQYLGKVGQALPTSMTAAQLQAMVNPVFFAYNPASQKPFSGGPFGAFAPIPTDQRDGTANPNSIIKLQYQHNIGTDQYIRVYGFQNWSVWPQTCPNTGWTNYFGYCPLNYYVDTYTSGVSGQYANQINDKNLINLEVSDFWAQDYRANDTTMLNDLGNYFGGPDRPFAYLVNSKAPTSGICYDGSGNPQSCYSGLEGTIGLNAAGTGAANLTLPATCGTGPCEWFVAENGRRGGGNFAKPNFGWVSLQDQWKPSQQLLFNIGARYTRYFYQLSDTGGPARDFWFNAWNASHCVNPGGGQVPFNNGLGACPAGTIRATMTNLPNDTETFTDLEPRVGGTYTVNPDNVIRFNYGRYNQPPNTAYEQYNLLQQDLASYDATNFWPIGFTTTTHHITPPTANNYDASWEHRFAGSDVSFKLTPFLRQTHGQIQNFFLDQKTGFVSGLNAGNQTSDGVEFELSKGDFNQNGLSGLFSFTYTHSFIHYSTLANGGSVLSTVNVAIQQYNSFTSACAGALPSNNPNSLCGTFGGANAIATEGSGIANPYFNAPAQPLFDLTGNYVPFSTIPGLIETASGSYETPTAAALILNFKHDKWAITPQLQFFGGGYYGSPLNAYGVDPSGCGSALGGSVAGDPRYPYGGSGTPYDALTCGGTIAVPNPYTHKFDNLGAFRGPNQILLHAQISYEVSQRVTMSLNLANIVNQCSGGTSEPWTQGASNKVCGYTLPGYSAPLKYGAFASQSAGGIFNPGSSPQFQLQFPYQQNPTVQPFNAYLNVQIKL